jgi:hypothetical protein
LLLIVADSVEMAVRLLLVLIVEVAPLSKLGAFPHRRRLFTGYRQGTAERSLRQGIPAKLLTTQAWSALERPESVLRCDSRFFEKQRRFFNAWGCFAESA